MKVTTGHKQSSPMFLIASSRMRVCVVYTFKRLNTAVKYFESLRKNPYLFRTKRISLTMNPSVPINMLVIQAPQISTDRRGESLPRFADGARFEEHCRGGSFVCRNLMKL